MSSVNGSFLDKTGLTYLWSQIKTKFMSKTDGTALANGLAAIINDGEKNILNIDFASTTNWGMQLTNNGDTTITLNGTVSHATSATYAINYIIASSFTPPEGYWILTCNELNTSTAKVASDNGLDSSLNNVLYMDGQTAITVRIYAKNNYNATNLTIHPMLCRQEYWNVTHTWVPKK